MDNNSKLELFRLSLEEMASREYKEIEQDVNKQILDSIAEEVSEYEAKKKSSFEKSVQKIEKGYNKNVYNYELKCKKELIEEQKNLKNQIKNEAIKILMLFTEEKRYENFLENSIQETINKTKNVPGTLIGLTAKDIGKFGSKIEAKFNVGLKEINSKYIGGCILENEIQGIFIDNTLLNCINEKMSK